jgi:hypothetical protein
MRSPQPRLIRQPGAPHGCERSRCITNADQSPRKQCTSSAPLGRRCFRAFVFSGCPVHSDGWVRLLRFQRDARETQKPVDAMRYWPASTTARWSGNAAPLERQKPGKRRCRALRNGLPYVRSKPGIGDDAGLRPVINGGDGLLRYSDFEASSVCPFARVESRSRRAAMSCAFSCARASRIGRDCSARCRACSQKALTPA